VQLPTPYQGPVTDLPAEAISGPLEPAFNREVRCHCGASEVVSRMSSDRDAFVVCSRGCFDSMVAAKPQYWEVMYRGRGF
jgi:hypothetical protein